MMDSNNTTNAWHDVNSGVLSVDKISTSVVNENHSNCGHVPEVSTSSSSSSTSSCTSTSSLSAINPQDTKKKHREIHNMVERMRRYRIGSCIATIAGRLPNLPQDKLDKSSVLETALRFLKFIRNNYPDELAFVDEEFLAKYGRKEPSPTRDNAALPAEENLPVKKRRKRKPRILQAKPDAVGPPPQGKQPDANPDESIKSTSTLMRRKRRKASVKEGLNSTLTPAATSDDTPPVAAKRYQLNSSFRIDKKEMYLRDLSS